MAYRGAPVSAMSGDGCASGSCTDCHTLSREEAVTLLGGKVDNVLSVEMSPVRGLREVAVEKDGKRWPLYIDSSKDYVVAGQIVQVSTKKNLIGNRMLSMNRVDVPQIPLEGSIVVGKKDAGPRRDEEGIRYHPHGPTHSERRFIC